MQITTKAGDGGSTRLLSNEEVKKDHPIIEAGGWADEFNCRLGLARIHSVRFGPVLKRFQQVLLRLSGYISSKGELNCEYLDEEQELIDLLLVKYGSEIGEQFKISVPCGNDISALIHLARTSCRTLERHMVLLIKYFDVDQRALRYVNRLSDVLYLMAIISEKETDCNEDD